MKDESFSLPAPGFKLQPSLQVFGWLAWMGISIPLSLLFLYFTIEIARRYAGFNYSVDSRLGPETAALYLKLIGSFRYLWLIYFLPLFVTIHLIRFRRSLLVLTMLRVSAINGLSLSLLSTLMATYLYSTVNGGLVIIIINCLILAASAACYAYMKFSPDLEAFYYYPDLPPSAKGAFEPPPAGTLLAVFLVLLIYRSAYGLLVVFGYLLNSIDPFYLANPFNALSLLGQALLICLAYVSLECLGREVKGERTRLTAHFKNLTLILALKFLAAFYLHFFGPADYPFTPAAFAFFYLLASILCLRHILRRQALLTGEDRPGKRDEEEQNPA